MHPRESGAVSTHVPTLKPCPRVPTCISSRLPVLSRLPACWVWQEDRLRYLGLRDAGMFATRMMDHIFSSPFHAWRLDEQSLMPNFPRQSVVTMLQGEELAALSFWGTGMRAWCHTLALRFPVDIAGGPVSPAHDLADRQHQRPCNPLSPLTPSHKYTHTMNLVYDLNRHSVTHHPPRPTAQPLSQPTI